MRVGIVKDDIYLEHTTEASHPENAGRLYAIYSMLERMDQSGFVYVPGTAGVGRGDCPQPHALLREHGERNRRKGGAQA